MEAFDLMVMCMIIEVYQCKEDSMRIIPHMYMLAGGPKFSMQMTRRDWTNEKVPCGPKWTDFLHRQMGPIKSMGPKFSNWSTFLRLKLNYFYMHEVFSSSNDIFRALTHKHKRLYFIVDEIIC